jgi:large subunit ribosomal protein L6
MSRIGKRPVPVPKGVTASVSGQTVTVKGPKGELKLTLVGEVRPSMTPEGVLVTPVDETQRARAMWGMQRTLVQNLMVGVTEGYKRGLEIVGTGYRAAVKGQAVELLVGLSHQVLHPIPAGIKVEVPKPTEIQISGIDKQKVGQLAAELRHYRPPEPYQGKGVRYQGEFILRKEGKKK